MRILALIIFLGFLSCESTTVEDKSNTKEVRAEIKPTQSVKLVETNTPTTDASITIDYLMGKFTPAKDERFLKIPTKYASKAGMLLRKDAFDAFEQMHAAAKKDGVQLKIISATRPFSHQKSIWEAKWTGKRKVDGGDLSKTHPNVKDRALKILEYSSMPGSSRHHWGTDIDINALTNGYFAKGKGKKEYDWLVANAPQFGFCQPYSPKGSARPHGYNEEKWHWSYLPISRVLTEQYQLRIKNEDISGFAGAEAAPKIDIVGRYVLGIGVACH